MKLTAYAEEFCIRQQVDWRGDFLKRLPRPQKLISCVVMKVQRIVEPETGKNTWLVLGDDYLPIEPIREFLTYLKNLERSPNTIRSYAYHLKLYWEYLSESKIGWQEVNIVRLAEFITWLLTG